MSTPSHRQPLVALLVGGMLLLASCGGDDGTVPEPSPGPGAGVPNEPADTSAPPTSDSDADVAPEPPSTTVSAPVAGQGRDCPSEADMSEAAREPMALDTAYASPGSFCPYASTDADPPNIDFSVTYTPMNMTSEVYPQQEEVPGLGQRALWADGVGELLVWTGGFSIIVSLQVSGHPDVETALSYDDLGLARRIAEKSMAAG